MAAVEPLTYREPGIHTIYLRAALAAGFLSAVADRFGLWGPRGSPHVAWGDFPHFLSYTGLINPWAPAPLVPVLGWSATAAEVAFAVALLLGYRTRLAALGSGVLLLLFGLGMTMGTGIKTALDASVFAASAAGFALALSSAYPWSLDALKVKAPTPDSNS